MTRDPLWDELRAASKANYDNRRQINMRNAMALDDGGWTKHSDFHWSRMIDGEKLDYWPSKNKFQHRGKVRTGDVMSYIARKKKG